jgi:hypothetical protein
VSAQAEAALFIFVGQRGGWDAVPDVSPDQFRLIGG